MREPGNDPLCDAHDRLDAAVLAAYDFDPTIDVLPQVLDLSHLVAERERVGVSVRGPGAFDLSGTHASSYKVEASP